MIKGADGRSYKSRTDRIHVDNSLTDAIQITRDPIMPIVDELKQSRPNRYPKSSKPKVTARGSKTSISSSQEVKPVPLKRPRNRPNALKR